MGVSEKVGFEPSAVMMELSLRVQLRVLAMVPAVLASIVRWSRVKLSRVAVG